MRHEGSKPATGFVARALDALQHQYPDNLGAFRMTPIAEIRRMARQAAERTARERGLPVEIADLTLITKIAVIVPKAVVKS